MIKLKNSIPFLLAASLLVACTTTPVDQSAPKQAEFDFDITVAANLGPTTLATRPPACGTWIQYLRGVVKAESNWKADSVYVEKFIDSYTGQRAKSIGLFQLSVGDKLNYRGTACNAITEETLKDPRTNTLCALEIIETLLKKGRPLGAYWSVIRDGKVACNG